jgi:acyl carrier protein
MATLQERLKNLMADVFAVDVSEIDEHSSPDTIERWDSVNHLTLVIALEEQFGVTLSDDDVRDIVSYTAIERVLRDNGVAF